MANTAALMLLIAIAHRTDQETGIAVVTYDALADATGLSRVHISAGLKVLIEHSIISPIAGKRSHYGLCDFDPKSGWAILPYRRIADANGRIVPFRDFHLRKRVELDQLKLYLVLISRRDRSTNVVNLSYDSIVTYTGIDRPHIPAAKSKLIVDQLIHVDQDYSINYESRFSNVYRIIGIDPYRHAGTVGRAGLSDNGTFEDVLTRSSTGPAPSDDF